MSVPVGCGKQRTTVGDFSWHQMLLPCPLPCSVGIGISEVNDNVEDMLTS